MASQLRPYRVTATGTVVSVHAAIKGVSLYGSGGTGTLVLRDGNASGEILVDISAVTGDTVYVHFEDDLPTRDDTLHALHATISSGVAMVYLKA